MKGPLDAIRALALQTKEVEEIIVCHAIKVNLIELASLLMVAQERVLAQGSNVNGFTRIRQSLFQGTMRLSEDFRSIDQSQYSKVYKESCALMSSVFQLLEVFERVGLAIAEYAQYHSIHIPAEWVPKHVAWMLRSVKLKEKDVVVNDIKCFLPKLQSEELKECRSLIKKFRLPLKSQQGGVSYAKSMTGIPELRQRYPVSSRMARLFHTIQIAKPSSSQNQTANLEANLNKTSKIFSHLPSNEQWVYFACAIPGGLRRL
ncbi:hypothetical protein CFOL_v3_16015 [Cephalotus follicularis]|uniref:Uncharacterized protein n=1 Tax=Cephalotus follicularis TaxID=3775 RepID=A0A1Q3BX18_CEPFO|nr:hypothetical protein CFOL_v3_16015 [Cephalotus follicularis]